MESETIVYESKVAQNGQFTKINGIRHFLIVN